MPPIRLGKGPVAIFPRNKKVKKFFNKIGTTIEIKDEKSSKNFWTISDTMASFYELLNMLTNWLIKKSEQTRCTKVCYPIILSASTIGS